MDSTNVPNIFIDQHLNSAKPEQIAVFLYGCRWQKDGQGGPSIKKTAADLGLRELDVMAALTYWEGAGLIKITDGSIEGFAYTFDIEETGPPPKKISKKTKAETSPVQVKKLPVYSPAEIEKAEKEAESIRYMFKMAERILGPGELRYTDMNLLMGFHCSLGLPVPVIEVLLDYCMSNSGQKSSRYLETVALSWADSGITTVDEAEAYIKTYNVDYREILKAMGHSRRDPAPKEMAYMRKWLREYKFPLEMILEACGKTVIQAGKPSFIYADKILKNWHEKDIRTMEAAQADEQEYIETRKSAAKSKTSAKTGSWRQKSRFANYKGRDWDYDELERLAAEYVDKRAQGK